MTKYDELVSNLETAMIRFILNISEETLEKFSAAERELCDAIKDLQDRAAVSDINKIAQNLVEMRSDLNRARIEKLEKELTFYRLQEPMGIAWTPVGDGEISENTFVLVKSSRPIFAYMGAYYFVFMAIYRSGKFYLYNFHAEWSTPLHTFQEVGGVTHYAIVNKAEK